jgi:hypothetical protein
MNSATEEFRRIATNAIDCLLAQDPVGATWLGDHRFDALLPDLSVHGMQQHVREIEDLLTALDAVDDVELETQDFVDLEILRDQLLKAHFDLTEIQEPTWNPMVWNPGTAIHLLLSRDFAPEQERLNCAKARAMSIPGFLETARETLGEMPAVHVETAIGQFTGTLHLVRTLDLPPEPARALEQHIEWLEQRLPESTRSPRRGPDLYSGILWHSLDHTANVNQLLESAYTHLDSVTESMAQVAKEYLDLVGIAQYGDPIRVALDHIASVSVVTNDTVLSLVQSAVESTRNFVGEHDLVSIPDIKTDVIEMPEIHRGVAVAYCDSPGPLEKAKIPTFVAVAPTPADWPAERQESFYREYNAVQIHDLTIHEAFPGHVLQLALSNHGIHQSTVRRCGMSGVFVEGWAVYAEELMLEAGYSPEPGRVSHLAIRLQQLKMQTRMIINTILDISVHSRDMSEEEAMALMIERGFQEEGEASGKWRRALLTAGQLPTYFVGYLAVKELAQDLRVLHPDWTHREIHDLMLSFGSPAPRHVRELVGL